MKKLKVKHEKNLSSSIICRNRKATHDYSLEKIYEAGLVLMGWEVKSIRAAKVQITDSYVLLKKQGEAYLVGSVITPLLSASSHVDTDPTRTRKLLLHRDELSKLRGLTSQKGYTLIPLKMYWKNNHVKLEIALAKGKQLHDKRQAEKNKDWNREKQRLHRMKLT